MGSYEQDADWKLGLREWWVWLCSLPAWLRSEKMRELGLSVWKRIQTWWAYRP